MLDSSPHPQKKRSASSQLPVGQTQKSQQAPYFNAKNQNVSTSTHRPKLSSSQQEPLKRSSIANNTSPSRDQMNELEPVPRRDSQNLYSTTSDSSSSSLPPSAVSYGVQSNYVPNLSSMMFPSADPFAYPNQPITTFEDRQPIKQENPANPNSFSPPSSSGAPYNSLNYGSLPYMMQTEPLGYMPGMNPSMGMSNIDPTPTTMSTPGNEDGGWPHQQQQQRPSGIPDINVDRIFGEDWGGWIADGYRQYP